MTESTYIKQRNWVNQEIARQTTGRRLTAKQRKKIWKKIWSEAKRRIK